MACFASQSDAANPSAKAALGLNPIQTDVDFEQVPADSVSRCRVVDIDYKDWVGWQVIAPDGTVLRRFADTNGDKKLDLWSYYKFGIEVYRDIDTDFDGKADEYRWLGTGGIRWGLDEDQDGTVDRWKQISAEEASAEVVAAVASGDADRFVPLLIDSAEIRSLGLGKTKASQIAAKASRAAKDFVQLSKQQKVISGDARWVQFAAATPGVVPSGTDGSTSDVVVYENVVAMYEQRSGSGQLMVGTLIKVKDAWRLVDLPSLGSDGEAIAQTTGNFFTPSTARPAGVEGALGEATQQLVSELEEIDTKFAKAQTKAEIEGLHARRSDVIEELIAETSNSEDRATWVRQLVDTLTVAVQSDAYPDGVKRLRLIARKQAAGSPELQSYADFEAINAEYVTRQTPDADFAKVQEWYLDALNGFVDRYPRTPEAAKAYLQLALSKEFEDKEKEALAFYKKVAAAFPNTAAGEKAGGAVRRLDSVGRTIPLEGRTLDGGSIRLSELRGKPVVVHYWATWCEPCKQDMKLLRRLQANYKRAGLQLVGVNVDATQDMATEYLKDAPLPWPQMFAPGGLESSPLANALGVQTLPTMLLISQSGKVVRHNVRAAELDEELEKLTRRKR